MGKGNKPVMVLPALRDKKTGDVKKGCNSPQGCLLNEDPPIDCSRNPNFVKVICDNDKCPRNQYMHQQCYDNWEDKIIIGVQKCQARTRDWTDDQVRRRMWNRIWDVSYRYCKCVCGGYLKRADAVELAERPEPPQAAAAAGAGVPKNKQKKKQSPADNGGAVPKTNPLPKLNQSTKSVYMNNRVSPWTAAGGPSYSLGAAAASRAAAAKSLNTSMESLQTSDSGAVRDGYIPGLYVEQNKDAKNQRRSSTSSAEEKYGFDLMKNQSFSSPAPAFQWAEQNVDDGDDWHVVTSKKGKSADLVPWFSQHADVPEQLADSPEDDGGTGDAPLKLTEEYEKEATTSPTDNEFVADFDAHIQLSDPDGPYRYGRDRFEIQCLLEEMNLALNM